jgi:hypothetical protein
MAVPTSLTGPVEKLDGRLFLRIPLAAGGSELVECSRGISVVAGDYLVIEILPWLAEKMKISEGRLVMIDNQNGKFNLQPKPAEEPIQSSQPTRSARG